MPLKSKVYSIFGPPWLCRNNDGAPRPFFGWIRGSGGPRVRTERLARKFGNHFFRPNLIYSSSAGLVPLTAIQRERALGFRGPVIHNQNGVYYPAWYRGDFFEKNQELARLATIADYVIFQSEFCRTAFEHFLPSTKVARREVLLNPSPDLSQELGISRNWRGRPLFLLSGNLGLGSEHMLIPALQMFVRIAKELDAEMRVMGTLPPALITQPAVRDLLRQVEENSLQDKVKISRYQQNDLPALLHNHRPIALHLRYKDACPNAVSEQLSLGVPHVFSQSGGTPELVGKAGIGIQVGESWDELLPVSADDLEVAVRDVLNDHEKFSYQARCEFEERLTFEHYARRHAQIFLECLR